MRIACGGIQHETNTFSHVPTTVADFARDSGVGPEFPGGQAIFNLLRGTGTIQGGLIDEAEARGIELLPLLSARAQPSGAVTAETFDFFLTTFLDRLKQVLPVDGVALDLHGAMVSGQHDDAEGAFIAAVRELVGPELPLVVTLDLHANITPRMAESCHAIIGFDTYPHVDMNERGREAIQLLERMIRGEVRPVQVFRQLPLVTMPPRQCTLCDPMQSLMAYVHELEQRPGMLTATVAMGFPFADIADAGVTVLATADGNVDLANEMADAIAQRIWELRDELQPELTAVADVIRFAQDNKEGLVIYADGSDNPGGGAPCDGTVALRALLEADFQGACVGILFDPETVEQAHRAGVGATIPARIGAKTDTLHGSTIVCTAYVRTLTDGKFVHQGPMMHGVPGDFGRMAVLVMGGVEVVLASRRMQLLDGEMLRINGIEPARRKLLVVKSAVHFLAHLGPLASHIFDADTPGIHRPDFGNYEYKKLRRPIYPIDQGVQY